MRRLYSQMPKEMLMNQIANPGMDDELPVAKYRHATDSKHAISSATMIPAMRGPIFIAGPR